MFNLEGKFSLDMVSVLAYEFQVLPVEIEAFDVGELGQSIFEPSERLDVLDSQDLLIPVENPVRLRKGGHQGEVGNIACNPLVFP